MRKVILVSPPEKLKNDLHLKLIYKIVEKENYVVFPLSLRLLLKYRKHAICHFHWIDRYHRGTLKKFDIYNPIKLISIFRVLFFLNLLFLIKILGSKIIWSVHNLYSHEVSRTIFEKIVIYSLLKMSDRVTVLNEYIGRGLKDEFNFGNTILLRQGIYEGCYPERITKLQARERLGIQKNKFTLLMFGSLLPYKGVDILLEAVSSYTDENLLVIIAGSSSNNPDYGSQIKDEVRKDSRITLFDKYISEEEIPFLFRAADYSIYPYREISNSGVIFLSFTFGIPIIISEKGGIVEVTNLVPETSILIKELNTTNIIKAINEAKCRPDVSAEMKKMQHLLSWKHLENTIFEVFNFSN